MSVRQQAQVSRAAHDAPRPSPSHVRGARLRGEHGQNAGATANIEHGLAAEQVLVVHDRVAVGLGAHFVFQHLLHCGTTSSESEARNSTNAPSLHH